MAAKVALYHSYFSIESESLLSKCPANDCSTSELDYLFIDCSDINLSDSPTRQIASFVAATLDAKIEHKVAIETKRSNFFNKYNITDLDGDGWLVAGDFFSTGCLAFEAVKGFAPALQGLPWVGACSLVFGVIGGVIDLAVGISCLAQGVKKLHKGQKLDGGRLIFVGALIVLIGVIMMTRPLFLKLLSGAAITTLVTNPIMLPILFTLLASCMLYEILKRVLPIWGRSDLGTQVMKKLGDAGNKEKIVDFFNLLLPKTMEVEEDGEKKKVEVNLKALQEWIQEGKEDRVKQVMCASMNHLEAKVGVESALHMFELMKSLIALVAANEAETALMMQEAFSQTEASLLETLVNDTVAQSIQEALEVEDVEVHAQIIDVVLDTFKMQQAENTSLTEHNIVSIEKPSVEDEKIKQFVRVKLEQALQLQKIAKQRAPMASKIRKWKIIQHVRFIQHLFYIGSTFATMGSSWAHANPDVTQGIVNTTLSLANFFPLCLDIFDTCKFDRNVPVDVPAVSMDDFKKRLL